MEQLFWISTGIIIYTFLGYGLLISILASLKKRRVLADLQDEDLPEVTLLVAAYNEDDIIAEKVENCLSLDYPQDKLKLLFVTDGSDDSTTEIIQEFPQVRVLHQPTRRGKIAAVNRAMHFIDSPVTVFTDANVMINAQGIRHLVKHFQNNLVGAVSGEKRVISKTKDGASASGEGLYWKYESYLKTKDSEWNSLVGSAGELFAIRTHLFNQVDTNTLIEDFVMTMSIAADRYRVAYEPNATATETASSNMAEEAKRKVRIAAGGIQAVAKLSHILNPVRQPRLFFQYISHRVLRWTVMPVAMVSALLANFMLMDQGVTYKLLFLAQVLFYALACLGYFMRNKELSIKGFFTPYYFVFMHLCVVKGWCRYAADKQQVTWEKAKRAALS